MKQRQGNPEFSHTARILEFEGRIGRLEKALRATCSEYNEINDDFQRRKVRDWEKRHGLT